MMCKSRYKRKAENVEALGLNLSSKLAYADTCRAVRQGYQEKDGSVTFTSGTVDFSPERSATPGPAPDFFPPVQFQPGSVGDTNYSPLVWIENAGGHIYNAPMVAFGVEADEISFCNVQPPVGPEYWRMDPGGH